MKKNVLIAEIEELIEEFGKFEFSGVYIYEYQKVKAFECLRRIEAIITMLGDSSSPYFDLFKFSMEVDNLDKTKFKNIIGMLNAFLTHLKKNIVKQSIDFPITLKYEEIIEELDFDNKVYEEIIEEINATYLNGYFTSMYILIRKLLENLIIDVLRKFYGTKDVDQYFDRSKKRFYGLSNLRSKFNALIKEELFISQYGTVDQKMIDLLKDFKDSGNINAHSLFSFPHQKFIEEKKEEINILLKRLKELSK